MTGRFAAFMPSASDSKALSISRCWAEVIVPVRTGSSGWRASSALAAGLEQPPAYAKAKARGAASAAGGVGIDCMVRGASQGPGQRQRQEAARALEIGGIHAEVDSGWPV